MDLVALFGQLTWETAGFAGVTLGLIYALKAVKMIKTGDIARVSTALIAALLSGASPEQTLAMAPVITALAAAGHELIEIVIVKIKEYNEKRKVVG